MSGLDDASFGRVLGWLEERNFSGTPNQYPPIAVWKSLPDDLRLRRDWGRMAKGRPLHVYCNVPYCRTRCNFCFLPVVAPDRPADVDSYLEALRLECGLWSPVLGTAGVASLYIGGGTPSLLSIPQLDRLFEALHGAFEPAPGCQTAFEANPAFVDLEKAERLKAHGVDWLSLGAQSLDPEVTRLTERFQPDGSVAAAYRAARRAGIEGVNIDLLCGLDGQSRESFLADVEAVARLRPDQIHLNLFEGTRYTGFARGGRTQARSELEASSRLRREGFDLLAREGYAQVDDESASLRPRAMNAQASIGAFLEGTPILGLGPGAVSHLPGAWRHVNHLNPAACRASALEGRAPVMLAARLSERDERVNFALNSLTFAAAERGELFSEAFRRRFGDAPERAFGPELRRLERLGAVGRVPGGWLLGPGPDAAFQVKRELFGRAVIGEALRQSGLRRRSAPSEPSVEPGFQFR